MNIPDRFVECVSIIVGFTPKNYSPQNETWSVDLLSYNSLMQGMYMNIDCKQQ